MEKKHSPRVLDSLALAYFLSGESGKAAGIERRAIAELGDEDPELKAEMERKLERYLETADEAGLDEEDPLPD